jgi:hypothetical protein
MKSAFEHDLRQEGLLRQYLDRLYLSTGYDVSRCADLESQKRGVDVKLSKKSSTVSVDEKAQLHYIGQSLPTFALELEFLIGGERRSGWLFDPTKETQAYCFVFNIQLKEHSTRITDPADVIFADIVLVERRRLMESLSSAGLSKAVLMKYVDEIRWKRASSRSLRFPAVRIMCSRQLAEEPVNLIVTRTYLESIGERLGAGPVFRPDQDELLQQAIAAQGRVAPFETV